MHGNRGCLYAGQVWTHTNNAFLTLVGLQRLNEKRWQCTLVPMRDNLVRHVAQLGERPKKGVPWVRIPSCLFFPWQVYDCTNARKTCLQNTPNQRLFSNQNSPVTVNKVCGYIVFKYEPSFCRKTLYYYKMYYSFCFCRP